MTAKRLFVLSSVLPPFFYYGGTGTKKFPATISFTIRKGVPRFVHHALWIAGWYKMSKVVRGAGNRMTKLFALQMFATGITSVVLCPLGKSETRNRIHAITAAMYMLDHFVLFDLFKTPRKFRYAFVASFLFFCYFLKRVKEFNKKHRLAAEGDDDSDVARRQNQIHSLDKTHRNSLFISELFVMIFENSMFLSFTGGMTIGLVSRSGLWW